MRVTVAGVHRYSVRVSKHPIYNEAGERLAGLAIESRRIILISGSIRPEQREEILAHEVLHAWEFHVPVPTTDEERCQLFATASQQLREDLERQGGVAALAAIEPQEIVLPYQAMPTRQPGVAASTFRITDMWECGCCGAPTMCGSIDNGHVEFHEASQQHQLLRWFRCEVCATLCVWTELATSDGRPTGTLVQVPAPKMLRGREAVEWIAERALAEV